MFVASTGRKIVIMATCIVLQLVAFGIGYALPVMYVEVIRVFGASRSEAALVQSIYMGTMIGGGFLTSQLIRRYGPGPCVIAAAVVGFVGLLVSSFAVNIYMIIVFTGVITGFGHGTLYLASFVTVSGLFHEKPELYLKLTSIGSSLGQFVFPYITEVLISEYQWHGCFLILSAIVLNCGAVGLLIYSSRAYLDTGGGGEEGRGTRGVCGMCNVCDVTLLKDPAFIVFLVNAFLVTVTGPIEGWFLVDIMMTRGFEREVGATLEMVLGFGNFLGRLLAAVLHIIKRIPTLLHWTYVCPILGLGHGMFINMPDYWSSFGVLIICGIGFGCTVSQGPAITYDLAGKERYPRAVALMNLAAGFGNAIGGLMGGGIKDMTGSYELMFYFAVVASVYIAIATVGMTILVRIQRKIAKRNTSDVSTITINGVQLGTTNPVDKCSVYLVTLDDDHSGCVTKL